MPVDKNNESESLFGRLLNNRSAVSASAVLSAGIVLSAIIAAFTFYTVRSFENSLSVTGSAKTSVTADSAKWVSNITRTATEDNLKGAYAKIASDSKIIMDFLKNKKVGESEITLSPVFVDEMYKYNPSGGSSGPREYTLRQMITVQSSDVNKISGIAKNTQEVISKGVVFSPQNPEYYYSKLADLRISLLADAVKDAKARAEKLAQSAGSRVGALKSASTGVVQVLAPDSIDVSDYGQYDTSSIEKDVMLTVRAVFVVQ